MTHFIASFALLGWSGTKLEMSQSLPVVLKIGSITAYLYTNEKDLLGSEKSVTEGRVIGVMSLSVMGSCVHMEKLA